MTNKYDVDRLRWIERGARVSPPGVTVDDVIDATVAEMRNAP
jgi:hypothetical protein